MSKRDYEKVARVLRETDASRHTVVSMASALAEDNERFNVERFINASTKHTHTKGRRTTAGERTEA